MILASVDREGKPGEFPYTWAILPYVTKTRNFSPPKIRKKSLTTLPFVCQKGYYGIEGLGMGPAGENGELARAG
jgi:hypothetical protein